MRNSHTNIALVWAFLVWNPGYGITISTLYEVRTAAQRWQFTYKYKSNVSFRKRLFCHVTFQCPYNCFKFQRYLFLVSSQLIYFYFHLNALRSESSDSTVTERQRDSDVKQIKRPSPEANNLSRDFSLSIQLFSMYTLQFLVSSQLLLLPSQRFTNWEQWLDGDSLPYKYKSNVRFRKRITCHVIFQCPPNCFKIQPYLIPHTSFSLSKYSMFASLFLVVEVLRWV